MHEQWEKYPNDRLILRKETHSLIIPAIQRAKEKMPLFCPVCSFCFSKQEDKIAFEKFECCSSCADTWAYSRQEDWKNGWRPSDEQIELLKKKRSIINTNIKFE